jgi:hypothetical protein
VQNVEMQSENQLKNVIQVMYCQSSCLIETQKVHNPILIVDVDDDEVSSMN